MPGYSDSGRGRLPRSGRALYPQQTMLADTALENQRKVDGSLSKQGRMGWGGSKGFRQTGSEVRGTTSSLEPDVRKGGWPNAKVASAVRKPGHQQ